MLGVVRSGERDRRVCGERLGEMWGSVLGCGER